mgnify:CR=1 FL=1
MRTQKEIEQEIKVWKNADLPNDLKKELSNSNKKQLEDEFYTNLNFGTAGMRGLLGVGTNRMNIFTVGQVTEALARHIDNQGKKIKERGVVISGDSRINSSLFEKVSAEILRAHDINVYLFSGPHPTPELSFTLMRLQAYAGIMITASHNTKDYNGYKLYGEDGGQLPPEPTQEIVHERQNINDIFNIKRVSSNIKKINEKSDKLYLDAVKTVTFDRSLIKRWSDKLSISFTPLHGAGGKLGLKALKQAGFNKAYGVKEQMKPDGKFPTVKYPNPEFHNVFKLSDKYKADIELAIDPDSDRMGVGYLDDNGRYQYLTGNQIASLMVKYILTFQKQAGTLPKNGAIITSNVSSNLPELIANSFNIKQITVLTGFKYIADKIVEFDKKKNYKFEFGFEESYGFLIKPFVHDKDGIQAITLMAEIAAYYKDRGMTIGDGLEEIYNKYGYFTEQQVSEEYPGENGKKKISSLMGNLRKKGPKRVGDINIITIDDNDLKLSKSLDNGRTKRIQLPKANVIKYWLKDGSWIAVRPSGTEPKLKLYFGAKGTDANESHKRLTYLEKEFKQNLA